MIMFFKYHYYYYHYHHYYYHSHYVYFHHYSDYHHYALFIYHSTLTFFNFCERGGLAWKIWQQGLRPPEIFVEPRLQRGD